MGACTGGGTSPGAGSNVDRDASDAWTNPGNITASNDSYASVALFLEYSDWLVGSSYGFSVPSGAGILGIQVEIERKASVATRIQDSSLRLYNGSALKGDDKATATYFATSDECATYGGATDLWGTTWTPTEINNMSVYYSANNSSIIATAYIDNITLRVWYTTYTLAMDAGNFTLTGADIDLLRGRILAMDAGVFVLTGADIDLLRGRFLAMDSGVFTLTGADIDLIYSITYLLNMGAGSFILTGADVNLLADRKLSIGSGSFSLTGQNVDLLFGRALNMGAGSFILSGASVNLLYNRILSMESGSFTLAGADVDLLFNRLLSMDVGVFTLTGQDITFTWSGLPVGKMTITFTPRKPGHVFTSRKPGHVFTPRKPGITFTGE